MSKEEISTPEEDFSQGLDYPAENEAGFEGLMSGENPDFVAQKTEKQKEQERRLIEGIKQLIAKEKIAQHSGYHFIREIINRLGEKQITTPQEFEELEKKRKKSDRGGIRDIYKISLLELLQRFEGYFDDGILSNRKLSKRAGSKYPYDEGRGPEYQERRKMAGMLFISGLYIYFKNKMTSKMDLERLNYEDVVNSKEFSDILFAEFNRIDWHYGIEPENYDNIKREYLNSPQLKFAFNLYKKEAWKKKIDPIEELADLLYGNNLISSYPPKLIKKDLEETGKLKEYSYDVLSVLFKVPESGLRKFPILEEDLGIINKVSPKDFVAIVVNQEVEQLPQEILDVIPEPLPVITTDFRVIRMPKEPEQKE